MNETCCICKKQIESESSAILSMGGFGTPRYMCDECENDIKEMTLSRDIYAINLAIERMGKKVSRNSVDDKITLNAVDEIIKSSAERREKIKDGTYDFSEEEETLVSDTDEEIPEELRESEEDAEAERLKAEKYKKLDAITNWILMGAFVGALGFMIYRILVTWFF